MLFLTNINQQIGREEDDGDAFEGIGCVIDF
jgi:hypothetical protein